MSTFRFPQVQAVLAGGATEAKQDTMITELQALNTDTDTLVAVDYATSAKQDSQTTELQAINTDMDTLVAVDYATSAKQDSQTTELQAINTDMDTLVAVDYATSAKQDTIISQTARLSPVDFLDSGVVDSSSSNIPAAGLTVVASLAAECHELEIIDDIGEYMTITDGSDTVLAYLPLGGGRVKLNIAASTAIKLASVSGSTISTGKIAINFLG